MHFESAAFLPSLKRQCLDGGKDSCVHVIVSDFSVTKPFQPANRPVEDDDTDKVFPDFLPRALYRKAVAELAQGGIQTLDKCLNLWREGRFQADMLKNFVESIAWQSPSLSKELKSQYASSDAESDCELLSDDDLIELKGYSVSPRSPVLPRRDLAVTSRRPSLASEAPALQQEDIQAALDLVNNTSMLDSSKTTKLTTIVRLTPALAPFFANNGWNAAANRFTSAPNWLEVQKMLGGALTLAPGRKRKAACIE